MRDGDGERTERELPVGALPAQPFGGRDRAAQRRVDARRAGQQRALALDAFGVRVPLDLAGRVLAVEGEVDRALDHREHLLEEPGVARVQVVVPHAVRDVARHVRVERVLLDVVTLVVRVPRTIEPLHAGQPRVGAFRRVEPPADVERHRGFDQVPRIGVATLDPRDVAVGLLYRRDRIDRLRDLYAA